MSDADHLRRLALQLAAQLPDDEKDAQFVLDVAKDLVRHMATLSAANRPSVGSRTLRLVPGVGAEAPIGRLDTTSRE
jgi:hypothetical protein